MLLLGMRFWPFKTGSHLTLKVPETKISDFVNSIDLDEVAHDVILNMI